MSGTRGLPPSPIPPAPERPKGRGDFPPDHPLGFRTSITGSGTYPPGRVPHFREGAACHFGAYPPGARLDAFPGSPVFAVHAIVLWYPGRIEEIILHGDAGAQHRWLRAHGFVT
ncbi:hypothetical protein LCGC14_3156080 [marine sediment metagenome]|uniref:Uncharacterized protein n=1 Tax=marine sediment metagenome TaxID=412755 RepID=A0A0F8VSS6_9ZZZZ